MKKILITLATIATAAALTGCRNYTNSGIYETIGTAASKTSFNINDNVYEIYADRLQPGETYIIILSDNDTPFNPVDDEILNYYDLETWELMQLEKE